jgi:hypothetical protein
MVAKQMKKNSNIHLKPPGIFQLFPETSGGPLNLIFLIKYQDKIQHFLLFLHALQIGQICPQNHLGPHKGLNEPADSDTFSGIAIFL